jgi:enoyl-CoA hydratase/carnithine racemase
MTSDASASSPTDGPIKGRVEIGTLEPGIVVVTFVSPARLNAISQLMREQLMTTLRELDADPNVGVIALTGAGDRAFSAGQDLSEARSLTGANAERWVEEWTSVYEAILNLSTPTVAVLNGYAVGAGLQIALMCDLRIASATARAGMPEINDAIPCITGSWALAGLIGDGQIADLVLTGRLLDAAEMLRGGLVSEVVEPGRLLERATELGRQLATSNRLALRHNKAWLVRDRLQRLPAAQEAGQAAHREAFESGEPGRVMAAFLSRRDHGQLG